MKKVISVLLAVLMLFSIMVPVAMAEETTKEEKTTSDHADFSEVWDFVTDDNGDVDWKTLPGSYLKIFAKIRFIEVIWNFFNMLFGGALNDLFRGIFNMDETTEAPADTGEPTTVAAEPTAEPTTVAPEIPPEPTTV